MSDQNGTGSVPTYTHTFTSSGLTVTYKKVAPKLVRDWLRGYRAKHQPTPPKQFVESVGHEVENPTDPDYQRALQTYLAQEDDDYADFIIGFATVQFDRDAVRQLREQVGDVALHPNDAVVFVRDLAALREAEAVEYAREILYLTQPSEEEIRRAAASFQG
jgi:hypothetical protein